MVKSVFVPFAFWLFFGLFGLFCLLAIFWSFRPFLVVWLFFGRLGLFGGLLAIFWSFWPFCLLAIFWSFWVCCNDVTLPLQQHRHCLCLKVTRKRKNCVKIASKLSQVSQQEEYKL
jgi:hypothetical protein